MWTVLTLLRPIEFPIKCDTVKSGWSIIYIGPALFAKVPIYGVFSPKRVKAVIMLLLLILLWESQSYLKTCHIYVKKICIVTPKTLYCICFILQKRDEQLCYKAIRSM